MLGLKREGRFSVGGRPRGRGQGREEWCDLSSKKLLFAIHFLRFAAHLSRALFRGRFREETDIGSSNRCFLFDGVHLLPGSGSEV